MATLNPRDVVIVDGVRSAMGKTKNGMFPVSYTHLTLPTTPYV